MYIKLLILFCETGIKLNNYSTSSRLFGFTDVLMIERLTAIPL